MYYQETMKVDVESIAKKNTYGNQYMKLLMLICFGETKQNKPYLLDKCKNSPNEPQFLPSRVKVSFKHGNETRFI